MDSSKKPQVKIKLVEINSHLTCPLCKGYFIDATTISECLHSFCRSCIIKFLHKNSYCPVCELMINKAKPNLKLDKTLQDIVYKLVPELFLFEMRRRQRFYRNYPELAAKVTPEEKGEDTERTIFNPRDTISLSIEYLSDDSTPGAIVIPQLIAKGADSHNKNARNEITDEDENAAIRRFLQCPGMCRIDVLKKFVRNKYNVDTTKYYIDILYKRVPLPDHYTLIDVAYIYSWKRNEPMKFFFKITDINLVSDTFDYLIPATPVKLPHERRKSKVSRKSSMGSTEAIAKHIGGTRAPEISPENCTDLNGESTTETNTARVSDTTAQKAPEQEPHQDNEKRIGGPQIATQDRDTKDHISSANVDTTSDKDDIIRIQKEAIEQFKKNEKRKEFTNVTLDRNNHVEIITKIQKVSNKSGLQIGIKITKQTFKKNQLPKSPDLAERDSVDKLAQICETSQKPATPEVDAEKSNFLKSIELTAKHVIKAMVPQMLDINKTSNKRKNTSPLKAKKCAKRPKKFVNIQPKAIQNPAVWQMVSNVNQNVSNLSKIVEQMTPNSPSTNSNLQTLLYDSYKINIPSSLSVTVKNEKDVPSPSFQKPVQNYIEILKLPDVPVSPPTKLEPKEESRLDVFGKLGVNTVEIKPEPGSSVVERKSLPQTAQKSDAKAKTVDDASKLSAVIPSNSLPNHSPHSSSTFQNMFEETLKKTETNVIPPNVQKTALNLSTNETGAKRSLMDIATKLYKKSKLEHDKTLNTATSNPPLKDFDSYISQQKSHTQTLSNLHSPKLGLNYTVSVTQESAVKEKEQVQNDIIPKMEITTKSPKKEVLSRTPKLPSPKISTVLNVPRKYNSPSSLSEITGTSSPKPNPSSERDQLNPDKILETYNIQNLAQLTANFNFPPNILSSTANQLAALRQAMIYRHFEMQNHQNWLNMNPGPLVQYEKYLKGFSKSST